MLHPELLQVQPWVAIVCQDQEGWALSWFAVMKPSHVVLVVLQEIKTNTQVGSEIFRHKRFRVLVSQASFCMRRRFFSLKCSTVSIQSACFLLCMSSVFS